MLIYLSRLFNTIIKNIFVILKINKLVNIQNHLNLQVLVIEIIFILRSFLNVFV